MAPCSVSFLPFSLNPLLPVEKTTSIQENVDAELLRSMREGDPMKLTGIPVRKPQENDAIPKIAPKWLKYDKQVGTQTREKRKIRMGLSCFQKYG